MDVREYITPKLPQFFGAAILDDYHHACRLLQLRHLELTPNNLLDNFKPWCLRGVWRTASLSPVVLQRICADSYRGPAYVGAWMPPEIDDEPDMHDDLLTLALAEAKAREERARRGPIDHTEMSSMRSGKDGFELFSLFD